MRYDVEKIKAAADIIDLVMDGLHLKKTGACYKAVCPFCGGGGFTVTPAKQIFKCFSCGKGGSVINYVMLKDNLEFKEALQKLAERLNIFPE